MQLEEASISNNGLGKNLEQRLQQSGWIKTEIWNFERDLRAEMRGHEAEMSLGYFKWYQEKNPLF